jgi:hypothetical protein
VADYLVVQQPGAKSLPLPRPSDGLVHTHHREGIGTGGDVEALSVEVDHDAAKALVFFADQIGAGHVAIVEEQLRGIRRPPAHFLQLSLAESGCALLD